ncbi:MAG: fibronectin type III domain-containing protein [Candidatus Sumerlaeota bacterium]|nr:fibronectin type III domain-containing protein [Candidatus Sumerlaeota bacterium]
MINRSLKSQIPLLRSSLKHISISAMALMTSAWLPPCARAVPDVMARDQIMEIANEHLRLRWHCDTYNIYTGVTNATCPYKIPGWQDGISYKWGGYDTRDSFYEAVVVNHGYAGDTNSAAIVSGTYGADCSGFASRAWRSGRYTTSSFGSTGTPTTYALIAPGDLMNKASSHVRIFEKFTSANSTMVIECTTGVSPGRVVRRVLSTDSNYAPLHYNMLVDWPSITRAAAASSTAATIDFLGNAATGFRICQSADSNTWTRVADETTLKPQTLTATIIGLTPGTTYYFRVAGVNGSAETQPSCVFPLRTPAAGLRKALIVNGYDRWTRKTEPGGRAHTFLTRTAQALAACNYAFDTIDNLRVIDQSTSLADYPAVWWTLGDESTADESFSCQEQLRVQDYLSRGGNLFVSGSEIAWDLVNKANMINDAAFAANYLKIGYASDGSGGNGYSYSGIAGTPFEGMSGAFDNGANGTFNVATPDVYTVQPGAQAILRYGTGQTAAVSCKGLFGQGTTPGSVVVLGFPFETITTPAARQALVNAATAAFNNMTNVEFWRGY